MSLSAIVGDNAPGGSPVVLLARLRGLDGTLVTRASLASISYVLSDLTAGVRLASGSLAIVDVIQGSLQLDARWTQDSVAEPGRDGAAGYNFAAVLPASLFPSRAAEADDLLAGPREGARYQCDVLLSPVAGEPSRVLFRWREEVARL